MFLAVRRSACLTTESGTRHGPSSCIIKSAPVYSVRDLHRRKCASCSCWQASAYKTQSSRNMPISSFCPIVSSVPLIPSPLSLVLGTRVLHIDLPDESYLLIYVLLILLTLAFVESASNPCISDSLRIYPSSSTWLASSPFLRLPLSSLSPSSFVPTDMSSGYSWSFCGLGYAALIWDRMKAYEYWWCRFLWLPPVQRPVHYPVRLSSCPHIQTSYSPAHRLSLVWS